MVNHASTCPGCVLQETVAPEVPKALFQSLLSVTQTKYGVNPFQEDFFWGLLAVVQASPLRLTLSRSKVDGSATIAEARKSSGGPEPETVA